MELKETSPSLLRERRHIENEKLKEEWVGCCSKTNKHFLKYIVQLILGGSVMTFAMVQICREVPNTEIYFSLLSGTLAVFMPAPQMNP